MNPITATLANHALEHATITLMMRERDFNMRIAGRATPSGFYVYGRVDTEELRAKADEALRRLQNGEAHLAVSPFCGTNLAVAGFLTAGVAGFAFRSGFRPDRLSNAVFGATVASLIAQPLGRLVQQRLTTAPQHLGQARIVEVRRLGSKLEAHQVRTSFASQ